MGPFSSRFLHGILKVHRESCKQTAYFFFLLGNLVVLAKFVLFFFLHGARKVALQPETLVIRIPPTPGLLSVSAPPPPYPPLSVESVRFVRSSNNPCYCKLLFFCVQVDNAFIIFVIFSIIIFAHCSISQTRSHNKSSILNISKVTMYLLENKERHKRGETKQERKREG